MSGVDLTTTLKNVKLMNGSAVLADNAVITMSGSDTKVSFEDTFIIEDSSNEIKALLVADLEIITDEGGSVSAVATGVEVDLASIDAKGVNSNDDIDATTTATVTSNTVTVVPALVIVSINNTLGSNDKEAQITFTIDKGQNSLTNDDVRVTSIELETAVAGSGVTVRNDEGTDVITGSTSATTSLADTTTADIVSGDTYSIRVSDDNAEVRIAKYGIIYKVGTMTGFTIVNDDITDLGEYDAN
ncbi:hypothetical protein ACFLY2_00515 [Patescibacteria group bacterium]